MGEIQALIENHRSWFRKVTGRELRPHEERLWLEMCWSTELANTVVLKEGQGDGN